MSLLGLTYWENKKYENILETYYNVRLCSRNFLRRATGTVGMLAWKLVGYPSQGKLVSIYSRLL